MSRLEKCIIFSAPSGAGKTTIVHELLSLNNNLSFSVSATSRDPRPNEIDGKDYHFLSVETFKKRIANNDFVEWEEVYPDHFYGTLKSEVEKIWDQNKGVIFDVDVYGGINLKKYFGDKALSFFIKPPSIEVLEERLRNRKTESEERLAIRLGKAKEELLLFEQFDISVVNNNLKPTVSWIDEKVKAFLKK